MMKQITSLIAIIVPLIMSSAVFAQDTVVSGSPSMYPASETVSSASQNPDAQVPMYPKHGMGMKHKGKCQHGKGGDGKKHGGQHDRDRHADVVRRLDRIEARMARIEAMLKTMLRR